MSDPVQEFRETLILRQGLVDDFAFGLPRISLHFGFPKLFDIQFLRVKDYRAVLPLSLGFGITDWSASGESEFLRGLPERRRRQQCPPIDDPHLLSHFHMEFTDGHLDVLAEDFVFMMISR